MNQSDACLACGGAMDIEALCSGLAGEATTVEGVPGIALTGVGRRGLQRLDAGGLGDGEGDGLALHDAACGHVGIDDIPGCGVEVLDGIEKALGGDDEHDLFAGDADTARHQPGVGGIEL